MDDVNEYDPALYIAIQQNARRYHMLFGDVIDSLIQQKLGDRQVCQLFFYLHLSKYLSTSVILLSQHEFDNSPVALIPELYCLENQYHNFSTVFDI